MIELLFWHYLMPYVEAKRTMPLTQIALYFIQEQGKSAEFTGVNKHFQRHYREK
jgi:hypothetical protein